MRIRHRIPSTKKKTIRNNGALKMGLCLGAPLSRGPYRVFPYPLVDFLLFYFGTTENLYNPIVLKIPGIPIQWNPVITNCHGTGKSVPYNGGSL